MRTVPILALALSACTGTPDRALTAFEDCTALQRYMRRMATEELRFDWGGRGGFLVTTEFDVAAMEDSDGGGGAAPAWSETNLQEAGVDEADLVKTDGTFLYAVAGGQLVIARAWPVEEAAQVGRVPVDGVARGLYLLEDRVVVLSDLYWGEAPQPASGRDVEWGGAPSAAITVVDVSDRAAPVVERETYVTGMLKTTRRIGDKLFVVTQQDVVIPSEGGRREARLAIYRASPEDWQGRRFDNRLMRGGGDASWQTEVGPVCACDETYASESLGGTWLSNALVLDLSDPLSDFEGVAVTGWADTVYMSPESLYVAYSETRNGPFTGFDDVLETVVHKFDVTGEVPGYGATGIVPGVLTDPFALSEKDGVLRIATTDFGPRDELADISNGIYTYEQDGGNLVPLDHVIGLAPGESITAARFVGDLGYFATWEVTLGDPLFTFDLSDPHDIVMGGELAVTGWSDYLHPIADGWLLAVGIEGDGWSSSELAISLYDVTDLSAPRLAERETLPAWGSEAQNEHHAFTWFEPTKSLTIPSWRFEGETVLEVLQADPGGIEPLGTVAQSSALTPTDPWCAPIRRSVVMGEHVWAVSAAGMTAARLDDPAGDTVEVAWEGVDPCAGAYYGW